MSKLESPKTGFYLVSNQPKPAGMWVFPCKNLKISVMKKPRWFHRKMMLLILGIDWEDIK